MNVSPTCAEHVEIGPKWLLTTGTIRGMRTRPHPVYCPDCGDRVGTHVTRNGKQLLLEFGAWPEGNVIIQDGVAVVLGRDDSRRFDGRLLLMPHAAQCRGRARVKQTA